MEIKLDNPAWYSLSETHKDFVIDDDNMKFYDPDYCPFGGAVNDNETESGIAAYASLTDSFFVIGNRPDVNDKVQIEGELVCNQMVIDQRIDIDIHENIISLQTEIHRGDLFKLVNLVQPGYFKNKTADLGSYYGIYKYDQLIAVTGERMKMHGYTELSAIVTHPEHTGNGYAKQLIVHASNKIFNESKIPYLHVADNNVNAIGLYEKLGFVTRKKISFWKLHANVL
ncbi:GNAT family N-acetyltransferase [Chryseobacterium indoltheticum]|jgi:ribosomal protein S18 acetylase RimI-like enzyme|uniref:GNAT family N-acetyltransferase n=2 Tax=Chryseobacterium indoltheticum TaxID=254 RepID=UPI001914B77B|nr:GNAT family N-acetyltransferase [Chryseobacterium indoltheticum]QQQ29166.1 GNAT family N-acetyltransferase [Chryseobacterium indoltheticum]